MAYLYVDTDGSGATSPFDTWAKAAQTLEAAVEDGACVAGSTVFMQGLTDDTSAGAVTITNVGTSQAPITIMGVANGTTNTGASVVAGDLASTLPVVECTGAGNGLTFTGGDATVMNIKLKSTAALDILLSARNVQWVGCEFEVASTFQMQNNSYNSFYGCTYTPYSTTGKLISSSGFVLFEDCVFDNSVAAATDLFKNFGGTGQVTFEGCAFTGYDTNNYALADAGSTNNFFTLKNCSVPSEWADLTDLVTTAWTGNLIGVSNITMIGCNASTSNTNSNSIQNYVRSDVHGNVLQETTVVRTGGASDGATGTFAYALTPRSGGTIKLTQAQMETPEMAVWVTGGTSQTLTIYFANSSASTDINLDELWIRWATPDSDADTSRHTMTYTPATTARFFADATAHTDDTGSTWGSGGNNHQKASITVTPGHSGWAYAKLYFNKATTDTLYVDPKIVVS